MKIKKIILAFVFSSLTKSSYTQELNWTKEETEYYTKTKDLCIYLKTNGYDTSQRNYLLTNFIYFVNPKNDTTQNRINYFDMLLYNLYHFVDSLGLENLDAKPVRFFKSDTSFYKPFVEDLKWSTSMVLSYYDKRNPQKPIGSLLFDPKSHKLVSWIMLNMDGYIFLTPNLY
jgi:hypothetical protein